MTRGTRALAGGFLFVAALWCGLLAFFGTFGARIVLETSPSRQAGGTVNRALLDVLDAASLGAALLLGIGLVVWNRLAPWTRRARGYTARLLVVGAVAAAASLFVVTPEMVELRNKMGTIDLVPREDPMRKDWGRLHGVSAVTLLVRLAASAGVFAAAFAQLSREA